MIKLFKADSVHCFKRYSTFAEREAFVIKSQDVNKITGAAIPSNEPRHIDPPPSVIRERPRPLVQDYEKTVNFTDCTEAYKSKSTKELIRSYVVFKLCGIKTLVKYNMQLAKLGEKVLGKSLFSTIMKSSFYGQFVAGEDQDDIKPLITRMDNFGVRAILDYAVEEDLSEEQAKNMEMHSCISNDDLIQSERHIKKYRAHREFADRRQNVVSARTYFYEGEEKCDENMDIFIKCIDAAGASTHNGFAAIKLTALGRPQFLLQFSEVLVRGRQLFETYSGKEGHLLQKQFTLDRFQEKSSRLGLLMGVKESKHWFTFMDRNENGHVDLLKWNELIAGNRKFSEIFVAINPENGEFVSLLPSLSEEEEQQMLRMLKRMDILAKRALEKNVRLMIDAEQTYFQPAINRITVEMMRRFNQEQLVVLNTYQCYLQENLLNMSLDMALAYREGFHFGCKLVRGAYMEQERERAATLNYADPTMPSYQRTTDNYIECVDYVLNYIKKYGKAAVMIASHNEESIHYTIKRMREMDISRESRQVCFGQLLGMCDHITYPLGAAGYGVYKYVPFGPVAEVLPYLSRRAQENSTMLSGVQVEKQMLKTEIRNRITRSISKV